MRSRFTLLFAYLLLWILAVAGASAQTAAVVAPAPEFPQVRLDAFNKVWNTVNERHFDPTFNGVDWAKVRLDYLPKAQAARTDEEFHAVLRLMLGELKLSHFNIFQTPPATNGTADVAGGVGVDVVLLGGKPVIERVQKGSPAETAGLRTGFVIESIDGKAIAERLKPLRDSLGSRRMGEGLRRMYMERAVESALSGKGGTKVAVGYLDAGDKLNNVELERQPYTGEMSLPFGNFPKQQVLFESRLLPENVGYIRFNMWVVPQAAKIRAAVREFAKAGGIIFDLRGNPGGLGGMAGGAAGLLTDKQLDLGSMHTREGQTNLIAYPQAEPYLGEIVILTDHGTGSTSEIFAAGLQGLGRAKVIGETTAGAVLPSVFDTLPTGWTFQYVVSDYRSPKNILIEGRGVRPDVRVTATRADLLAGRDPQLEAAVRLIAEARSK
jgi:carboxyl-terminal processing protease